MREDGKVGNHIKSLLKYRLLIEGLNLDRLINALKKDGITLLDCKKGDKDLTLTVRGKETEKLFAICKRLCYNIKVINH